MTYYSRVTGQPCGLKEWSEELGNETLHRVELSTWPDGTFVSTVFLGLDHSFGGGAPVLWETMCFGPRSGASDAFEPQWRYRTEAEARVGHRAVAAWLEGGLSLEDFVMADALIGREELN